MSAEPLTRCVCGRDHGGQAVIFSGRYCHPECAFRAAEAERDALARRVEALRAGLTEVGWPLIEYDSSWDAASRARRTLAADAARGRTPLALDAERVQYEREDQRADATREWQAQQAEDGEG